jgi:hypothetical protein
MKRERGGGRSIRLSRRRLVVALVACAVPIAVLGRVLVPARFPPVAILLVGAGVVGVLCAHAFRRLTRRRRTQWQPHPSSPPIEHVAADLRRLLWQHDLVVRRHLVELPAKRLWALETAITRRATQAARALEVPHPAPPRHRGLDRPQLSRLLRALVAEGLALPLNVGLMVPDHRR